MFPIGVFHPALIEKKQTNNHRPTIFDITQTIGNQPSKNAGAKNKPIIKFLWCSAAFSACRRF
jgi:hypothetical protein